MTVLVVAVLIVNGLIFGLGWAADTGRSTSLDPPGAVVGTVWVVLFVGFGFAR